MYIPEHFRIEDRATALAFMRANPFAILVSNTDDGPFATHVPVVIRESGDQLTIRGHVAKANPHWRYLQNNPACLMIFHGPHAYISPVELRYPRSRPHVELRRSTHLRQCHVRIPSQSSC